MPKVAYYPGCSLEATARDYQESIDGVAELLDLELVEVPDWNCCGASAAHSLDHHAALNLSARNLALAADLPSPLVVPCALCFHRLKSTQYQLAQGEGKLIPSLAGKREACLAVEVVELNRFLTSEAMIRKVRELVKQPLSGLKPVCYYGCQGQRAPWVTGNPEHENPTGLDRLLGEMGASVLDWPAKTDCCGASHAVARPDLVEHLVGRLYEQALERGANCVVTGCQMCQANLDLYQEQIAASLGREVYLPVFYITELVAMALEHDQTGRWLRRHMVNPRGLLQSASLPGRIWERL